MFWLEGLGCANGLGPNINSPFPGPKCHRRWLGKGVGSCSEFGGLIRTTSSLAEAPPPRVSAEGGAWRCHISHFPHFHFIFPGCALTGLGGVLRAVTCPKRGACAKWGRGYLPPLCMGYRHFVWQGGIRQFGPIGSWLSPRTRRVGLTSPPGSFHPP